MKKILRMLGVSAAAAVLASCGGGGGSPGDTALQYSISMRSDKQTLPLNIAGVEPGMGVNAPYTTAFYVTVLEGGRPVTSASGATPVACNLIDGLGSGALHYLDGDDSHYTNGVSNAYRSIALPLSAGVASAHFHAGNQMGTARIRCSVTDPRDQQVYSAETSIAVGGGSAQAGQVPAAILTNSTARSSLGVQGNTANLPTSIAINAFLFDSANQPVVNPSAPNLQVEILQSYSAGATLHFGSGLRANTQMVSTVGGVATFALSSGSGAGNVLLRMVTDRADNNVANGIQQLVEHYMVVPVSSGVTDSGSTTVDALVVEGVSDFTVGHGIAFARAFSATGGVPGYTWTATNLPAGLTLGANGFITGTVSPQVLSGTYSAVVTVTDSRGTQVHTNITVTVSGTPGGATPLAIAPCGSASSSDQVCVLPNAENGANPYTYAFSTTGGDLTAVPTWQLVGTPRFYKPARGTQREQELTLAGSLALDASTGVLTLNDSAMLATGCARGEFYVRATRGTETALRRMQVNVTPCI